MNEWNDNLIDTLTLVSFVIDLQNLQENMNQSNNDDIIKEVQRRTNMLLRKIEIEQAKQSEMILEKFEELRKELNNDNRQKSY